ncbi:hypothetical protein [Flavobacterium sp. ZB4P13]|uniref:hypothetical protein n=1 Tax=Flavobacterium sp. ZB4P13 TaxID=3401728 RepID=UPI003AAF55A9
MSGQEGMRGYIMQSIIAILESLNNEWDYIQIEPKTENDKVDIIWYYNESVEVCQVKSTIGQSNRAAITSWINGLYSDFNNAIKYKIIIVGDSTIDAKTFANNVKKETFTEQFAVLENIKNRISIDIFPLNTSILLKAINADLDKLFNVNEYNLNYEHKDLIAKALVGEFSILSTEGSKLSKKDFTENLLKWSQINFPNLLNEGSLDLSFWLNNKIDYSKDINDISISNIDNFSYYNKLIDETKLLISHMHELKLHKPFYEVNKFDFILSEYENKPKLITEYEQDYLKNLIHQIISIEVDNDFFNLGDLLESKKIIIQNFLFGYDDGCSYSGSESELKKFKLYNKLFSKLHKIQYLLKYWKIIQKYNLLPIVVKNENSTFKEDIIINLKIPNFVKIIDFKKFIKPNRYSILDEFVKKNGAFINEVKHISSSKVKNNNDLSNYSYFIIPGLTYGIVHNTEEFEYLLSWIFDYKIFNENDHQIIQVKIDSINTNEIKSFPSYIFFQSNSDFIIEYEINSKNQKKIIAGKLNYQKK